MSNLESDPGPARFRGWAFAATAALINLVVFDAVQIQAPAGVQVTNVPDDGYYYLSLARNFVRYRQWTFDSGVSHTSGFHPAFAYVLAASYAAMRPSADGFVKIGMLLSAAFTLAAALYVFRQGWSSRSPAMFAALTVLICTRNILLNSISTVEWPLIVLVITAFSFEVVRATPSRSSRALTLGLGFAGSVTRTDFGLLPFGFFAASLIVWHKSRDNRPPIAAGIGLAGAMLGTAALLVHNYLLTGLAVQSSALMKWQWANAGDTGLILLGAVAGSVAVVGLAILLDIRSVRMLRARLAELSEQQQRLGLAALLVAIGYTAFYSGMSGIQPWYSANLLLPAFVLLLALWYALTHGVMQWATVVPTLTFAAIASVLASSALLATYPIAPEKGRWPHQAAMRQAGIYLHDHPLEGRVGAWNAGIVNYYQGGTVINLDGVVNNDIYKYAVANRLPAYLRDKHIAYVVDFPKMLESDAARRGGYSDPAFLSSLRPIQTFDRGDYSVWRNLTLYRVAAPEE